MSDDRVAPARRAAYEVLRRTFEDGAWANRALPAAARRHGLEGRDRALAQRLAYGAIQRRGTLDHLIAALADRPAGELDPPLLAALRLGLYELLFADATPDHAAVDQAVELAKGAGERRGSGVVNALLRRAARERAALLDGLSEASPGEAAVALSHPRWLAEMWWSELGAENARAVMAADNEPAETALRVNELRRPAEQALAELRRAGAPVERPARSPAAPESLVVRGPIGARIAREIDAGAVLAQSRASAFVVELLDPHPGERILDLCAGPGIKTTQIAARMRNEGEVVAVENHPGRAAEIRELCRRVGAECVRVSESDAARDRAGGGYDRVLVDPPCSDLGTLASRPDARWRKSPDRVAELARLQGAIVERGAEELGAGGTLVYSTCTISRRENEDRIVALLDRLGSTLAPDDLGAAHPELASAHDARLLQLRPDRDRTDGFFVARLRRAEA
ncbi:MAG: 16S rRNA (cytosine(967)-C(5))-methyltransferase RsmB [Solirubrobacterales bacterium]